MFNKNYLWYLVPVAVIIILGYIVFKQSQTISNGNNQIAALIDTARLYRTKSGGSGVEKKVFTATQSDVLAVLKGSDKTAFNYVKNTSGIRSYSDFSTLAKVDTIVKADTVYLMKDSTGKINYFLSKDIKEPKNWYNATINIKGDSVGLKLQMKDEYHVITSEKSNGFLKGKSLVINIENENPYVVITGAKSFVIQPENKHIGLKVGGVAVIGLGAFLLLHK
ncbi:hypothetical protein [Mucilaginibacter sp.]|uniref:hypothetical protein n=1 Tax=Mucilaginibacter sp. TaxID=1882438 RepID=UPI003D150ECD